MHLTILSFFVLATATIATADGPSVNPPLDTFKPNPITSPADSVKPIVGRMTNAKRLALNLPPLKPKALQRGTPAASAPRSGTSMSPPVPHKCNILVKNADDENTLGYVSPTWNIFGEYGIQEDQADALEVTFYFSPDDPAPEELDVHADNGPSSTFPYFGTTTGFASTSDDLSPDSFNYAYITGTTQIPPGSPPSTEDNNNSFTAATTIPERAESAVWKFNPSTQDLSAQWINTDGSRPKTHLVYYAPDNVLIITGDVAAFQSIFGTDGNPPVTLTCVPPVVSQVQPN